MDRYLIRYFLAVAEAGNFSKAAAKVHVTQPTLVATYAFVNPIIALILGWLLANEPLTRDNLIAAAVIVASVGWLIGVQWWRVRRTADLSCNGTSPDR